MDRRLHGASNYRQPFMQNCAYRHIPMHTGMCLFYRSTVQSNETTGYIFIV